MEQMESPKINLKSVGKSIGTTGYVFGKKNKIGSVLYTTLEKKHQIDQRSKYKTWNYTRGENMSEFLYHLKVGKTFLAETQNPEAIKKKRKIQLYRTFKWQAKQKK